MLDENKNNKLSAYLARQQQQLTQFIQALERSDTLPVMRDDVCPGVYVSDSGLRVEVLEVQLDQVIDRRARVGGLGESIETMSVSLFLDCFAPVTTGDAPPEALEVPNAKHFDLLSLEACYEGLCERYVRLDRAFETKDREEIEECFLETLFKFFIMANHLGYSARYRFRTLRDRLFAFVDLTEAEAKISQGYYQSLGIETHTQTLSFYEPGARPKTPLVYYVQQSSKRQKMPNGRWLAKDAYLRARSRAE